MTAAFRDSDVVELHLGDGNQIRDAYMERRYKVTKFLQAKVAIKSFEILEGSHRWDNVIAIEANPETVRKALEPVLPNFPDPNSRRQNHRLNPRRSHQHPLPHFNLTPN